MDSAAVDRIRHFNRAFVQRLGVLDESYLRLGRPLSEARLIYEIGTGADLRGLRRRLALDSGYLSRLVRSLERQGLVAMTAGPTDGRVRSIALTAAGRAALAAYDKASDAYAAAILAPLTEPERRRLLTAMGDVERLMSRHAVEVMITAPEDRDLAGCFDQYFAELAQRFDDGFDRTRYLDRSPDDTFRPPEGYAFLARLDGVPVGCGVLKVQPDGGGEAKRIWTAASARGRGVARQIMAAIEAQARQLGLHEVRLSTHRTLTEAQRMYPSLGYVETPPFDDDPFSHRWYRKALVP